MVMVIVLLPLKGPIRYIIVNLKLKLQNDRKTSVSMLLGKKLLEMLGSGRLTHYPL
jgi:hypothetical protein